MSCQLSVVRCQLSVDGRSNAIENRRTTDNGQRTIRTGVTLIELLIVILIISILAALVLGVAAVAAETAREAQTRHMVERMHTLFVDHYNTYKTRRVKLRQSIVDAINNLTNSTASQKGRLLATARLMGLREMMMMEVPNRWSDVLLQRPDDYNNSTVMQPFYLAGRTDLSNVYLRRFQQLYNRIGQPNSINGQAITLEDIKANQSAECLYLVITLACGDGEARTLFAESSIGDTDGDGAPEILDGWGHPVSFLRWAPGFDSQIQLNANLLGKSKDPNWLTAAAKDHDPFDLFRVDPTAFRLVPLIFSGGRDEAAGLRTADNLVVLQGLKPPLSNPNADPTSWPIILPWTKVTDPDDGTTAYLGTAIDGSATDNVHNHLMGQR